MSTSCVGIRAASRSSTPAAPGSAPRSPTVVLAVALVTGCAWLLAAQAVVFALGAAGRSPYGVVYARLVRPRLGPPAELEDTRPLRFAQAVGLVFTLVALAGLTLPTRRSPSLATAAALAAAFLNAAFGICLGCEVYLLLRRATSRHPSPARSPTTAPPTPARRSQHEHQEPRTSPGRRRLGRGPPRRPEGRPRRGRRGHLRLRQEPHQERRPDRLEEGPAGPGPP